jgi:hypothetical protein
VRLRLAHFSDVGAIAELNRRQRESVPDLRAERLVQFDPRRRYVVCAIALIDGAIALAGVGAIALAGEAAAPEVLICDPEFGQELCHVLREVLCAAARASPRVDAA